MTQNPQITRQELKNLIREILKQDKNLLNEIMEELKAENETTERDAEFDRLLHITNEKYKTVWEALA